MLKQYSLINCNHKLTTGPSLAKMNQKHSPTLSIYNLPYKVSFILWSFANCVFHVLYISKTVATLGTCTYAHYFSSQWLNIYQHIIDIPAHCARINFPMETIILGPSAGIRSPVETSFLWVIFSSRPLWKLSLALNRICRLDTKNKGFKDLWCLSSQKATKAQCTLTVSSTKP